MLGNKIFLTENNIINKLDKYDIPKATRALSNATNINKQREIMGCFIDPVVVQLLDDNMIDFLFKKIEEAVETKIRLLIKEDTGEEAVAEGRKVKLLCDFDNFKKGTEAVIKKCIRFEEDTFGDGWYAYDVEIIDGSQLLHMYRIYRNEFELL